MAERRRSGSLVFVAVCVVIAAYIAASKLGLLDQLSQRLFPHAKSMVVLSPGDFPAGVAAPVGDVASVPVRPSLIGFNPRGSSAALLLAAGGSIPPPNTPAPDSHLVEGLFKTAYALDARAVVYAREEDLKRALSLGAERGGVDMAAVSVDALARWSASLRDAAPRVELLMGRSHGQEAIAAVGAQTLRDLKGKRFGVYPQSSAYYFALWAFSHAGLLPREVTWVDLASVQEAGAVLREGRADAVAGLLGDVELAARDRGGTVLQTSADAPHLVATVLVARGDFAARYPDAVRRVLRGLLDAGAAVKKDSTAAERLLADAAPYLGDPAEAIRLNPPADLKENLAFFGVKGEAPVTYNELFQSAVDLFLKMGKITGAPAAEDTQDLTALKYISEAHKP